MNSLELKIPPVAPALLCAAAMWATTTIAPPFGIDHTIRLIASTVLGTLGAGICLRAVMQFRGARTTVNPTTPNASSALVTNGIYRLTRNPMYLGFLLLLSGWSTFLDASLAWAGPMLFVVYMNRFQITPEERTLTAHFGDEFVRYQQQVRRWL